MNKMFKLMTDLMPATPIDVLALGVVDFKKSSFETCEAISQNGKIERGYGPEIYFDLASLTKPLTNSLTYFLNPKKFDEDMLLCLNHRGSLPAWGILPKDRWREQILSYPIKAGETLYSDFSALRVLLEFEKKGESMKNLCLNIWDKETVYWTDLSDTAPTIQTGFKDSKPNFGKVHDPNAYNLNAFCSHAGLFSTISGLCRTLIAYQQSTDFIGQVRSGLKLNSHRFCFGWDRVENPDNSLAGQGCGPLTFGHLGFTGTSIWIDPDRMIGHVILSNATKNHWFDKVGLNSIRRAVGEYVWNKHP